MKLKFNWGTGVVLGLVVMVLTLSSIAIYFMSKDVDLVETGYYEKELGYQDKINQINNTNALSGKIYAQHNGEKVIIIFPNDEDLNKIEGEVLFYKPSDDSKDFKVSFNIYERRSAFLEVPYMTKGMWKMKMIFKGISKDYYSEQTLIVN